MKSTRSDDLIPWQYWDEPPGYGELFTKMIGNKLEGKITVSPTRTIDFRRFVK
jgi:hypothetical protein